MIKKALQLYDHRFTGSQPNIQYHMQKTETYHFIKELFCNFSK